MVLWGGPVLAAELKVAVAANFGAPMQRIAAAFERDTGHKLVVALGSTGRLYAQIRNGAYAQIRNGAPFEVFLSADDEAPARLEKEGLAVAGSRLTYATGRLVLWSAQPGVVDAEGQVLRRPPTGPLAVADPKLAPYGRAAMQALTQLKVLEAWRPRLVQGESITQAHQFVASGNAPLGLVAMAQVMQGGKLLQGSAWVLPAHLHEPIRQDAVLLARGQGKPAAAAFLRYLRSDAVRALIRGHGYED
jgi:molybdate transport system substrate-binding protein